MLYIILSLLVCIFFGFFIYYKNKSQHIEIVNEKIQEENKNAEYHLFQLKENIETESAILDNLIEKQEIAQNAYLTFEAHNKQQEKIGKELLNNKMEAYKKDLEDKYSQAKIELEEAYKDLTLDLVNTSIEIEEKIKENKKFLDELKNKQKTYLEEQKRKEEMKIQQEFYKLNLNDLDKKDIDLLREIQNSFSKKETIDKVIWENYYKPAYDTLIARLFKSNKEICGIYKITCLENEKAYIGQSTNIAERFRAHIKSGIAYATNSNKLYQEMKKNHPYNFTFEILEQTTRDKLNEREKYWIDFYDTKTYGLNTTQGGS